MKTNKLVLVLLSILLLPTMAFAQMETTAPGGPGVTFGSLQEIIHKIENAFGLVFGALAVLAFLFAGIRFLTAGGEAEKVSQARNAFMWGIAGVVVGILAFSIVAVVGSVLG